MVYRFQPTHLVRRCKRSAVSHADSLEIRVPVRRCTTARMAFLDLLKCLPGFARSRLDSQPILFESENAVVLGADEKHLSFRWVLSVQVAEPSVRKLRMETAAVCHDWIGHAWIAILAPIHRLLIRSAFRRLTNA